VRVALSRMRYLPLAAFVGLSLLWGSGWLLRASTPAQPRLRSLAIQYAIAAAVLLPWAIRRRLWRRPLRSIVTAVIVGLGILCLPQLLIFMSAGKLSPAITVACLAMVAVFLAITGRLAITPAVVGLAGVLFLLDRGLDISVRQLPWLLLPLTAAGVLAWGLGTAEKHMQRLSIVEALFGQCVASAVLLFLASEILEDEAVNWSVTVATGFAISAVFATVCGYLLFYWLLGKFGAGRVSTLQWTQPLVATLETLLLAGGHPDWSLITGATLIVFAVLWVLSNREDGGGVIFEITRS
jgi:drug/metabolite transporter (DMT)-like permease